jgi:hypothetical protein
MGFMEMWFFFSKGHQLLYPAGYSPWRLTALLLFSDAK